MNTPISIDTLIEQLNRKEADSRIFNEFIACLAEVRNDIGRGKGINFSRDAGSKKGELQLSSKCFFLRTLPLDHNECFIALHRESGFYSVGRKSRYSADLLGIWKSRETTRLSVAELKQGVNGDSLVYAVAEGLRNIYLAMNSVEVLRRRWSETLPKRTESYTGKYNPFSEFGKSKKCELLIIGDELWVKAKVQGKNKAIIQENKTVTVGNAEIRVAVYSFAHKGKSDSKPHALLPLKRIL